MNRPPACGDIPHIMIRLLTLCLTLGTAIAAPVEIRNRWQKGGDRWLGAGGDPLATTSDPSGALWTVERSGDGARLRHEATGRWLAITEGKPSATDSQDQAAGWTLQPAGEDGWFRFLSATSGVLHVEGGTGTVECTRTAGDDWWSAMWRMVTITGREKVVSPGNAAAITFQLADGRPEFSVRYGDELVVSPSPMGFTLENAPPLAGPFRVKTSSRRTIDETWKTVFGQFPEYRNHANELTVDLEEAGEHPRLLRIVLRAYDDGVAFRYEFPEQPDLADFRITDELTAFHFTSDATTWWVEDEEDSYERDWNETSLAQAGAEGMHTPVTLRTGKGNYVSLHEASLLDWSSMKLKRPADPADLALKAELVPWIGSPVKVIAKTPHRSPWRTLQLARRPGGLVESGLILNLNEPCAIADTSWIEPAKFMGIWWGMITDMWTWDRSAPDRHGATTERAKRYIDACARHGIGALLVEGWCEGWEGGIPGWRDQNFTKPYPDFDIREVCRYGKEKGVSLIGHHETGGDIANYERQIEAAFDYYEKLGVNRVKTGYVSGDIPVYTEGLTSAGREHHDGQFMVRHYQRVAELAAKHRIMIDAHEPIKGTGIERTWPNFVAREGARGGEFNHFAGNPPRHCTILPFTWLLGGPMDYTPGLFDCAYRPDRRFSTRANQLALYVVIWSPLQMAADHYQAYEGEPAMQFIRNVPVGKWDETRVLDAAIGDYVVTARRSGKRWYLGAITNENARCLPLVLDFLDADTGYDVVVYGDAPDADYRANPNAMAIRQLPAKKGDTLELDLRPGGGAAIEIYPAGDSVPKPSGNAGTIEAGKPYRLFAKHSDRALTTDGKMLFQTIPADVASQRWTFQPDTDSAWTIRQDGKAVSATDDGVVEMSDGEDAGRCRWKIEHVSGSQYRLIHEASGKLLDVSGVSYANGAKVHLWEPVGSPNQIWWIEPAP